MDDLLQGARVSEGRQPHHVLADLINAVGNHYTRAQAPKPPPLDEVLLVESQRAMVNVAGVARLVTSMGVPETLVRAAVHRFQLEQVRVEQQLITTLLALPHEREDSREA